MAIRTVLGIGLAVVVILAVALLRPQRPPTNLLVSKNVSQNVRNEAGQAISVYGPDEGPGVDHVRITQYGFGIDPIFGCDFANGTMADPRPAGNRETLCTFQGRGFDGRGYAKSTVQFRVITCEDWNPSAKCTHVMLSTTERGTTHEYAKVNWSDGGHIEYGNALPTLAAGCGASATIEGSDNAFAVTLGTGVGEGCTVAFKSPWLLAYSRQPYAPMCVAGNQTRPALVTAIAVGSTGLTLRGSLQAGDRISVVCVGRHDWPAED
jgi:hypothetical protein